MFLTRYANTGARNLGSQQNQRQTNLAKLRKTKLLTQKRETPNPFFKDGGKEPGISTKLAQKQSNKAGKNKTTDT